MKEQKNLFGETVNNSKEISSKKRKNNQSESEKEIDGGKYDQRNKLNDLGGASWLYWTKTVINTIYPSNCQHKLRSAHGGQKPPELCADLIRVFTKKRQLVLDPLAGVGGTLLGASLSERNAIGIELNQKWIDIYRQVCELEGLEQQEFYQGDSNNILTNIESESIDFVLTDVPYWIMDKVKKTRSKNARESRLSKFNEEKLQTKEEWLLDMKCIFDKVEKTLKNKKYMAVFIGDMYYKGKFHLLGAELATEIEKNKHFKLKSDIIWQDNSKGLHIYGYPFGYIPSIIHQHILVFRKEI